MMNKRVVSSIHDSDYLFKLVIVGSSNVGKSSLLMRLMDKSFENSHCTTIGADCVSDVHVYFYACFDELIAVAPHVHIRQHRNSSRKRKALN